MSFCEKTFCSLGALLLLTFVVGTTTTIYFDMTDDLDSRKPNYVRIGYIDKKPVVIDIERVKKTITEIKSTILK